MTTPPLFSEGAGIEWDFLNDQVLELIRIGKYDRAPPPRRPEAAPLKSNCLSLNSSAQLPTCALPWLMAYRSTTPIISTGPRVVTRLSPRLLTVNWRRPPSRIVYNRRRKLI